MPSWQLPQALDMATDVPAELPTPVSAPDAGAQVPNPRTTSQIFDFARESSVLPPPWPGPTCNGSNAQSKISALDALVLVAPVGKQTKHKRRKSEHAVILNRAAQVLTRQHVRAHISRWACFHNRMLHCMVYDATCSRLFGQIARAQCFTGARQLYGLMRNMQVRYRERQRERERKLQEAAAQLDATVARLQESKALRDELLVCAIEFVVSDYQMRLQSSLARAGICIQPVLGG